MKISEENKDRVKEVEKAQGKRTLEGNTNPVVKRPNISKNTSTSYKSKAGKF